jgi:hypothetical protein
MQCHPTESPEPKRKRVARKQIASDSDSDTPFASPSRAKNNRRIKKDDSLLLLSTNSTFVASSSAAAKQLLQTHVGGHVFTRGSDTQSVYICCRSCTMKCRAGCKKQDLQAWRIIACCDSAMEACPGRNSSTDIPEDSAAQPNASCNSFTCRSIRSKSC